MKKQEKKKRVIVGMSGGVDSSVAAAVLKARGYDVTGVFMRFWHEPESDGLSAENVCCSRESFEEARKAARILDIPLHIANVETEFKKEVVDCFSGEYETGRTPNPCVRCNREIKFKTLFKKMLELGADHIATGHYARIVFDKTAKQEKYKLASSIDKQKDQSYFLYSLDRNWLERLLFPIGEFENKKEVRSYAEKMKLPMHAKKDSQDVCFVADSIGAFLRRNVKMAPGDIVDAEGNVLGKHRGLPLYTLGQRKGINIGGKGPFYVVGKNIDNNEIVVTNNQQDELIFSSEMKVKNVNWIREPKKYPATAYVKTRYHNDAVRARIKPFSMKHATGNKSISGSILDTKYLIRFDRPQRAITPGQSAVFYSKGGEVLGGGIIS